MSKVRTYGISKETLSAVTSSLFLSLYTKTRLNQHKAEALEIMADMMEAYPDQCRMIIMGSVVFAIGNFDRIDKIEGFTKVLEDGSLQTEGIEIFNPEFIV